MADQTRTGLDDWEGPPGPATKRKMPLLPIRLNVSPVPVFIGTAHTYFHWLTERHCDTECIGIYDIICKTWYYRDLSPLNIFEIHGLATTKNMLILRHIYIEIALLQLKTDRQIFTFEGEIEQLSPGDLFIGQIFAVCNF